MPFFEFEEMELIELGVEMTSISNYFPFFLSDWSINIWKFGFFQVDVIFKKIKIVGKCPEN